MSVSVFLCNQMAGAPKYKLRVVEYVESKC